MQQAEKGVSAVPSVGDEVYVGTCVCAGYSYQGGRARIRKVEKSKIAGRIIHMVSVEEHPFQRYNWEDFLSQEQPKLKEEFGDNKRAEAQKYRLWLE